MESSTHGTEVLATAPCRVDLAGGTLDIWPLGLLHPGAATVNVAVEVMVTVRARRSHSGYVVVQGERRSDAGSTAELRCHRETSLPGLVLELLDAPAMELHLESGSPLGGGLGASSALTVAMVAAVENLLGRPARQPDDLARFARDVEASLMELPTGMQDHYPALLGGVLDLRHRPGGTEVRPVSVDLGALGDRMVVVYTGQSHFSAGQNWRVVRRRLDGEAEARQLFEEIAAVSREMPTTLEAGDWEAVGRLLTREWASRRRLAEGVSSPTIERLLEASREAGAWGGKACGAGGGGCLVLMAPPGRRSDVVRRLTEAGAHRIRARPTAAQLAVEGGEG